MKAAAEPYFKILVRWIHRGLIDDPGKDFFVEDNEVIERAILPLEYSDDYWERRYALKMDQVRLDVVSGYLLFSIMLFVASFFLHQTF